MKWCRRCQVVKHVDAFAKNRTSVDGLQAHCRQCQAAAYRTKRQQAGYVVRPADVPEGHKFCRTCQTIKPVAEWSRHGASADGLQGKCKACTSEAGRRDHLHRKYGMTEEQFAALFAEQEGYCAICLINPAEHIDHDHETGLVRGLLCFSCNAGLGQFAEDPSTLRAAADYVATYGYRLPSTHARHDNAS